MKYILMFLSLFLFSCFQREPKAKIVVDHIVKSKVELKRWDPVIQVYVPRYRYFFTDGDSMTSSSNYWNVGDTIKYTYIKF